VTNNLAPKHNTPVPESHTQRSEERDTLNDTPELRFLRDEIEALLGAASVQRSTPAPRIGYADDHEAVASEAGFGDSVYERDTEPSLDVRLLREAVRVAGK
jgi:hypothetical protein